MNYHSTGQFGEFAHLCAVLMRGHNMAETCRLAENTAPARVVDVLHKAATGASDLSEVAGFSGLAAAFMDSLRQASAFDAMLSDTVRVPFSTPVYGGTETVAASVVAEGAHKPVTRIALDAEAVARRKAAAIVVCDNWRLDNAPSAAMSWIGRELRAGVARATDEAFLADLTDDVTPTTSTGDPVDDLGALLAGVGFAATSRLYLVIAADAVPGLATVNGSFLFPGLAPIVPVVSDGAPSGTMTLVDATGIVTASEPVRIDRAMAAAIKMDDQPAGGHGAVVSMFQTNCSAIRAERSFGWHLTRDDAVAVVEGVGA